MKIKRLYYDVPKCPKCKSPKTGIIMYGNSNDKRAVTKELKSGNYVYFYEDYRKGDDNCFCVNCGFTWLMDVSTVWLTDEEITVKAIEKGISPKLIQSTRHYLDSRINNYKEHQKQQAASTKFLGKIKQKFIQLVKEVIDG